LASSGKQFQSAAPASGATAGDARDTLARWVNPRAPASGATQWEREQHRSKGELISSFDPRTSKQDKSSYVRQATAKARYDSFLRSKGVNPKTMGAATILADGSMAVLTIEGEYAQSSSLIRQNLTAATE